MFTNEIKNGREAPLKSCKLKKVWDATKEIVVRHESIVDIKTYNSKVWKEVGEED